MGTGRIVLISGPCGSGKTTVSRMLAESGDSPLAVHIHTDDFYQYIRRGYIPPWWEDSGDQNETVVRAAAACGEQYALGEYEVYVDGVVGPWFLGPWKRLTEKGLDLRYVVLRPGLEATVDRAMGRDQQEESPLKEENVRQMWEMFSSLGGYEAFALDTTEQTAAESARLIRERIRAGLHGMDGRC